jgi:hypothetical protein
MFQNVFVDPKISKEKQIFFFFSMSFGIFVSFLKKIESLCFPISHTCLHAISYKCKYMLRLFQEINMIFFFETKLVSNKYFSFKYLIQGFNPHLFS